VSARRDRLAVVLKVRKIQEERRQADLARALADAAVAQGHADAALRRFADVTEGPTVLTAAAFVAARGLVSGRAEQVAVTSSRHEMAVGEGDRARALLTEAMTRTSGLERLVEREDFIALREMLAADQRAAEESAGALKRVLA
jgi:flagellar protein FliJ